MFGPTPFRDIFLVAGFELREMMRSRRAFLFTVLYILVAAAGSYLFVEFLTGIHSVTNPPDQRRDRPAFFQNAPATPSRPAETPVTPGMPEESRLFQRGSPFRGILSGNVDEEAAVEFMASKPAIVLFHLFISLTMMPMIIMITSSESIAQEHQSRGVRFIGLRTGRAEFVLGKLLGQCATLAVMTLLAGGVCMAIAWWKLADFEFMPALSAILLFWPRLLAYCIAFLGLAGLCSMNSNSTVGSRTFSIVGLVSLWIMNHLAEFYQMGVPVDDPHARVWHAIQFFSPFSHQNDLWYPEFSHYGVAMIDLVILSALYVGIGLIFYRRRDL
jgi:ABC-type transport system involved in multi-copper enzyme maturation permease subunit